MGLEVTITIDGLDESWPLSGDNLSQSDDHHRQLKAVLKNIFPGSTGDGFSTPITANEVEINILDGVTRTTEDVNDLATKTGAETLSNKTLTEVQAIEGDSATNLNVRSVSGNLHLDSSIGSSIVHINYYHGTGGVAFGNGASGSNANVSAAGVFTGIEFVGQLTGNVTGNSDTVTTNANLTGDVTSVGNATTIADEAVVDANLSPAATTAGEEWVLSRTALASAGDIGTYVFAKAGSSDVSFGSTIAGSSLNPTGAMTRINDVSLDINATFAQGSALTGTWRCMGQYDYTASSGSSAMYGATLWLRIS